MMTKIVAQISSEVNNVLIVFVIWMELDIQMSMNVQLIELEITGVKMNAILNILTMTSLTVAPYISIRIIAVNVYVISLDFNIKACNKFIFSTLKAYEKALLTQALEMSRPLD